ncbi:contractile injection system protein, VgrG/Pvc8 family [Dickeya fangzhongdai]|uniref:contractile injection system protein, VgrG/Pvc8 family n=1 Tax=Dickeya fangzhongdai TaxID=1778540 RepID=UPI002B25AD1D|nr:contractile injection system protein, VgrG/Pvc8 family [Dickeya fangzhongdai]WOY04577.1 contractile injection system protein, VgrG/Pvc8 family [Dickeya fangzhongdai]
MIVNNRIGIADQLAPDYQITLSEASGDAKTTRNLSQRLISLSLHDVMGFESDQLSLDIDDSDGKVQMPKRGEKISLRIGWKGKALADKGTFIVDQVSHTGAPDRITLSARSVNFRGDLNTPRDGSYDATTLGDIARTIAERYSLLASIENSLAGTAIAHENQSKESDLSFLCRLARRYSGTVAIKSDTLRLFVAGTGTAADGKNVSTYLIERSDGDSHSFTIADRIANTSVTANWHDSNDAKTHTVKISRKRQSQPDTVATHPNAKSSAQSSTPSTDNYLAGEEESQQTLQTTYSTQDDATQAALSKWRETQRGTVTFSLTLAKGMENLKPGALVRLKGFKQVMDERQWTIKRLTHTIAGSGFITAIELEVSMLDVEYDTSYSVIGNATSAS